MTNCAYCDCDELERLLQICDKHEGIFGFVREARATLDGIRADHRKWTLRSLSAMAVWPLRV